VLVVVAKAVHSFYDEQHAMRLMRDCETGQEEQLRELNKMKPALARAQREQQQPQQQQLERVENRNLPPGYELTKLNPCQI
jgi:hypothetical protein